MWHPNPKSILTSRTAWFGVLTIIGGIATIVTGHTVKVDEMTGIPSDELAAEIANVANVLYTTGGATAFSGLMVIIFRMLTKRPATLTGKPTAPPSDPPSRTVRGVTLPVGILLAFTQCYCPDFSHGLGGPPHSIAANQE